jgi:transcriptional regulator with XRE-family HTH domain
MASALLEKSMILLQVKFGERLQELRGAADISQQELADKSDLSVWVIRDLEQGRRLPTFPTLRRLTIGLRLSLSAWDGLEDEKDHAKPARKKKKKT